MPVDTQLKIANAYTDLIDAQWFDRGYWLKRSQVDLQGFGRGSAFAVLTPIGRMVVKHYRRGGLVARFSRDQYLFQGHARSRAALEFDLLSTMRADGLPVPEPIAARTERDGVTYRCDLITRELPRAFALADLVRSDAPDQARWAEVGATIARFHSAGIYHDDLNAQNVLLSDAQVYLIDFDRGERKRPERRWQQANLDRLLRSIKKNRPPPWPEALEKNVAALLHAATPRE